MHASMCVRMCVLVCAHAHVHLGSVQSMTVAYSHGSAAIHDSFHPTKFRPAGES